VETRTAGSASGLGKRTSSNAGTAPQADSSEPAHLCFTDRSVEIGRQPIWLPACLVAARVSGFDRRQAGSLADVLLILRRSL